METDPASVVTINSSGVVAMAFAQTGFALLCTMPSEAFPRSCHDLVEMLKDNLARLAPQPGRAVGLELLMDIEGVRSSEYLHSASPFTACTCIGSLPSFE